MRFPIVDHSRPCLSSSIVRMNGVADGEPRRYGYYDNIFSGLLAHSDVLSGAREAKPDVVPFSQPGTYNKLVWPGSLICIDPPIRSTLPPSLCDRLLITHIILSQSFDRSHSRRADPLRARSAPAIQIFARCLYHFRGQEVLLHPSPRVGKIFSS